MWALFGATVFTAVALAGAALLLVWPDPREAPSAVATAGEGAVPAGGTVGDRRAVQPAGPARVTTNGMAELDGDPAATTATMVEGTHDIDPGSGAGAARAAAAGTESRCGLELRAVAC